MEKIKIGKEKNRKAAEAGLTLEAALVIPVLLAVVLAFFQYFVIINFYQILQNQAEATSRQMAGYAYLLEGMQQNGEEGEGGTGAEVLSAGYAWNRLLSDEVKRYCQSAGVVGGMHGISLLESSFGRDGVNDLQIRYMIRSSVLGKTFYYSMANRCYFRSWIGERLSEYPEKERGVERLVYITRKGKVYHENRNCTYLHIVPVAVNGKEIEHHRNAYGARYKPCSACMKNPSKTIQTVYITSDGRRYHGNSNCHKIRREVTAVPLSKVEGRRPCSRCS